MSRGSSQRFDDDVVMGKAYDGQLLRRMAPFVAPYGRRLGLAIALLIGAALSEIIPPLLVQRAINDQFNQAN